jgi:hypothetical protein
VGGATWATGLVRPPWAQAAHRGPRAGRGWRLHPRHGAAAGGVDRQRPWPSGHGPSTVGPWLRSFTFEYVRRLDRLTDTILSRASAAGAGPADGPLLVDVDSTICEVRDYHKQGACYGYTHRLGYHPLLVTRADTGEVLHARLRKGSANTARGIVRFVDELVARLRRAGAVVELTFRMDSGFWSAKVLRRLRQHRVRCSVTVRQTMTLRAAIAAIPEADWGPDPVCARWRGAGRRDQLSRRPADGAAGPQPG